MWNAPPLREIIHKRPRSSGTPRRGQRALQALGKMAIKSQQELSKQAQTERACGSSCGAFRDSSQAATASSNGCGCTGCALVWLRLLCIAGSAAAAQNTACCDKAGQPLQLMRAAAAAPRAALLSTAAL